MQTFLKILVKIRQQLVLLAIVSLVLLATYVSLGRQFMPAISRYAGFLENQILLITGVPVSVESLSGSLEGFNPRVRINGLTLLVGEQENGAGSQENALQFERSTIEVNMARSIWERRWVLEQFQVENLRLDFNQTAEGNWLLGEISMQGDGSGDPASLFDAFRRVARLDLTNVAINFNSRSGDTIRLVNGLATIQNIGLQHYFHVNANLEGNRQQVSFSMEVTGNNLDAIDGTIHLDIPNADYSSLFRVQDLGPVAIDDLVGAGDLWVRLQQGSVAEVSGRVNLPRLNILVEETETGFSDVSALVNLSRGEGGQWQLALSEGNVSLAELDWDNFNAYVNWIPGQEASFRADHINLDLLREFAVNSGVLEAELAGQVTTLDPRGQFTNLSARIPMPLDQEGEAGQLSLKTNLQGVAVESLAGAPAMGGVDGYLELVINTSAGIAEGFAEVDSGAFSMHIPNIYTRGWDYDYVNGRLSFRADFQQGLDLLLTSSVIVAENDAVNGRIKFSNHIRRPQEGERESELELLIGALRLDAKERHQFLPDGPNIEQQLRNSMEFLQQAILDGQLQSSGAIFRGSTIQGSAAETKTFQSFYLVDGGLVDFNQEWPNLENLQAFVRTNNNDVDIEALSGSSLALDLGHTVGQIRRDENNMSWITVRGSTQGATAAGLEFLQQSPVSDNLKQALSGWRADGTIGGDIEVRLALSSEVVSEPEIHLDLEFAENSLYIEGLDLAVENLAGNLLFDSEEGLNAEDLQASLFGGSVQASLVSEGSDGAIDTVILQGEGVASDAALGSWSRHSNFVRKVLAGMDGNMAYSATLRLPQDGETATTLELDSGLQGVSVDLPTPYAKARESSKDFNLRLAFEESSQFVEGRYGDQLQFTVDIEDGFLTDGAVLLGSNESEFDTLAENSVEGLVVLGNMEHLVLEEIIEFISDLNEGQESSSEFATSVAFVDVATDMFEMYGQALPNVNFRIEPEPTLMSWSTMIRGESVQGTVSIPYQNDEFLELNLEYLRLPGDEEELAAEPLADSPVVAGQLLLEEADEERVDVLLDLDPRVLPPMNFATQEFMIGSRPYGSWSFRMTPTDYGAEFSELVFDFRGLRLGMDEVPDTIEQLTPSFTWFYDNGEHRSSLSGVMFVDDIADVLRANGMAASLESSSGVFVSELEWPGSPAFFSGDDLSGRLDLRIEDGRFLQGAGGSGALKLVSIINFSAIMRRLRLSDDLVRSGLAFDDITGSMLLDEGLVDIQDQLVISGPSSLYQITGDVDLEAETISGEMYVTLPVSDNIPWIGLLTANIPLAVGAYLFDQIFGDQINSLTSAVYTLEGPWEGLEPEFKQAFGSPEDSDAPAQPQ